LSVDSGPTDDVGEGGVGGPAGLRVAVKDEPERLLGPSQFGHARIDEGVENLEAKA